jgi:hypothetical protein
LNRYRLQNGEYKDSDLEALRPFLSQTPKDPWGNQYFIDPLFRRIISAGGDALVGQTPDSKEAQDDQVFFYKHPWRLRIIVDQNGVEVPFEMRVDGWEQTPVQGDFLPGMTSFVEHSKTKAVFFSATGEDNSLDLSVRLPGEETSKLLVTGPGDEVDPALSQHGEMVYFSSVRTAPELLIFRVPAGGGPVEQVTQVPDRLDHPDWNGDFAPSLGNETGHLAFHSIRGTDGKKRICFIPKGKPMGRVVVLKAPFPPGTLPSWSLDGKTVFFLSEAGTEILGIPFPPRGKKRPESIRVGRAVSGYALSPDGDFALTYSDQPGGGVEIISVATGARRVVFRDPGVILFADFTS